MPSRVIDCLLFGDLASRDHLPTVMEVTAVVVACLANPEWLVEIEATAVLP